MQDESKWVKSTAYGNLGKFIHSLKGLKISQQLIDGYCRMAEPELKSITR